VTTWEGEKLPDERITVDQEAFVELLSEDLELEYKSIVQYVQHIASVKGAEYLSTLDELSVHVKQELDHALTLARQIDFLGGVPSTRVPDVPPATDARTALTADLELEQGQLERYRERVEQADTLSLPDVAETLAPLLEQTQEHARDLRAALG
jgi:bacterioferritin